MPVAPKLVYATGAGQSSVRVFFDQAMRMVGAADQADPVRVANWAVGGGLPAVTAVTRLSDVEFELTLAEEAPLAGGYSVTVAGAVESAAGEAMDPGFVSYTFAVTVPDLRFTGAIWFSPEVLDIVFSEPLATIDFDQYRDVLSVEPNPDFGAQQMPIIGLTQSGSIVRVTFESAGTSGARYLISLNREVFVALATNVTLKLGDEQKQVWAQGRAPKVLSGAATERSLTALGNEVIGLGLQDQGWPLLPGAYTVTQGSLGSTANLGSTPASIEFPDAQFTLGDTIQWQPARVTRAVTAGASFLAQASASTGAGTETVGVGVTTLNKTAGDPFEVVFSGGLDSLSRAGRLVSTTVGVTFTPSGTEYALLALTLLNTQVSLVLVKTSTNQGIFRLYRGQNRLAVESLPFSLATPFQLALTDATSDADGWLAVSVDGDVVLGAPARDLLDNALIDPAVSATAVALTLGDPTFPAATFSITFSSTVSVQSFLTTGLRGVDSRNLLSFGMSSLSLVVGANPNPPPSPGYLGTGVGAFGVHAEYVPLADAIQVVIGLNQAAPPPEFTGTVSLLTGEMSVLDQALLDQTFVLTEDGEIVTVFLHPKQWMGVLVGVTLDIGGSEFSVTVPVTSGDMPATTGVLTQQPASWYHPRLNPQDSNLTYGFGPSGPITGTP